MSWVVPEQLRDTIIEIQRQIRVSRQKQMKNEKKLNKKQTNIPPAVVSAVKEAKLAETAWPGADLGAAVWLWTE